MSISVLKEGSNIGTGSALMSEMISAVRKYGYEQLKLEVVTENQPAISLYKNMDLRHAVNIPMPSN